MLRHSTEQARPVCDPTMSPAVLRPQAVVKEAGGGIRSSPAPDRVASSARSWTAPKSAGCPLDPSPPGDRASSTAPCPAPSLRSARGPPRPRRIRSASALLRARTRSGRTGPWESSCNTSVAMCVPMSIRRDTTCSRDAPRAEGPIVALCPVAQSIAPQDVVHTSLPGCGPGASRRARRAPRTSRTCRHRAGSTSGGHARATTVSMLVCPSLSAATAPPNPLPMMTAGTHSESRAHARRLAPTRPAPAAARSPPRRNCRRESCVLMAAPPLRTGPAR